MNRMSADERASLAVWLDVRDLGRMARAARGWAEHGARRQVELAALLAATADERPWAAFSLRGGGPPALGRLTPGWSGDHRNVFVCFKEPVGWSPRAPPAVPVDGVLLHWVGEGRGITGEWLAAEVLDRTMWDGYCSDPDIYDRDLSCDEDDDLDDSFDW